MLKCVRNIVAIVLLFSSHLSYGSAAVTYQLSGGRFGDNLIAYMHALWIAYRHGVQLLYTPFKYGDQLVLGNQPNKLISYKPSKRIVFNKKNLNKIRTHKNYVYEVPYFSEFEVERNFPWNKNWIYFPVDWNDPAFYQLLRSAVKPVNNTLNKIDLPADCVSVAVHVRRGGTFEGPLLSEATIKDNNTNYIDAHLVLRFPPNNFYVEQLKRISALFKDQKIYVFVFTDLEDPAVLVSYMEHAMKEYPHITFDYHKVGNSHDANVVEDFFAMTQFDCLIRPQSNYSLAASKISNYKIEIVPTKYHWEGTKAIIDEIEVVYNRTEIKRV